MQELVELLRRDCRPFLSLLSPETGFLFRGADANGAASFKGTVRRDRRPKNMTLELHEATDAWFSQTFGIRYRGAALFCTGRRAQAEMHGVVHAIFPCEGFQFCWSPLVGDLFEWAKTEQRLQLNPTNFVAELEKLNFQESNLAAALSSGCEVMLSCQTYHAVRLPDPETQRQLVELLTLDNF